MARICSLALLASGAVAFTPATRHTTRVAPRYAESVLAEDTKNSESIMVLDALPLAADYGFDPLGLSKVDLFPTSATDKTRAPELVLRDYRDAELRHGRLAMLAALAWPVQELISPSIARFANRELGAPGLSDILAETGGRSPNVLNGALEQTPVTGFLLGVAIGIACIDSVSLSIKDKMGDAFIPGDFGFDPLRILTNATPEAVADMQEKEINNGRLAMMAVLTFVIEEALTGKPITQVTPFLFQPLFDSPGFMSFLDNSFGIASAAQKIQPEAVTELFEKFN